MLLVRAHGEVAHEFRNALDGEMGLQARVDALSHTETSLRSKAEGLGVTDHCELDGRVPQIRLRARVSVYSRSAGARPVVPEPA
jgi:hypothetical protein